MTYIDTLLVDGHDVRTLPGVVAVDAIDGLYAPGFRRGDDDVIPGMRGVLGAEMVLDKYLITVPVVISADTTALFNSYLHTIAGYLSGTNGLVTLTRRLDNGSGYDEYTAAGRTVGGLSPAMINWSAGSASFQFYNLEGGWHRSSDGVFVIP